MKVVNPLLERCFQLIEFLAEEPRAYRLGVISERLGLQKGAAHRLLARHTVDDRRQERAAQRPERRADDGCKRSHRHRTVEHSPMVRRVSRLTIRRAGEESG